MTFFLIGVLLAVSPPDMSESPDECLSIVPQKRTSPLTSINDAQQQWTDEQSVSRDTLQAYLSRAQRARECLLDQREEPPLSRFLSLYEQEAVLHAGLRQFSEAFEAYQAAASFRRSHSSADSSEIQEAHALWFFHQQQGYLHYLLGNLSASIEQYLRAYEATPDSNLARRAQFLIDVGTLHQRTQDYRSAQHYYGRAEHLFQTHSSVLDDHSQLRARLYQVRADLLLERTLNTNFNRDTLKRAFELARRGRSLASPGSDRHARLSLALSESIGYLGSFEKAYTLNRDVERHARRHDDVRLQTLSLLKLGVLHMQTERWVQAVSVLNQAHTLANTLGDLDYQRRVLRDLGRLHEHRQNWKEAERAYRKGMDVIEEYRESLTASQWSMTAFAQWRDVHRGLVRVLLAQDRPREAFTVLDRSRARHLRDLRTQARVSNDLSPDARTHLDSLSRSLTEVRNRLADGGLSDARKAALRNREVRLMADRQQVLQIDSATDRSSLDAISDSLTQQDRALVAYFLDDPWPIFDRPPRSAAFVLTGDTLRTVSLSGLTQDSVRAQVKRVSTLFTTRDKPDDVNAMHFDLRPLHQLHDAVYAPVAAHLQGDRPLTVVPDGPLFHLPFSMLVDSMPGGRFAPSAARYALHDRPISLELAPSLVTDTSPSAADWSKFDPHIAAYGVSDFDTLKTVPSALRTALPEALSDSSLILPSLPGVEKEMEDLQTKTVETRVALNGDATEAEFCRSIQTAGVLHVASHAFVNAASPLQNAILLHPDSSIAPPSDGLLFLHELQQQQSRIPLVVLSGCNTASGTLRDGEGMEGLQYAFRAMGAQSTVSNLWPVADGASVELMNAFYQHLQDGHPKDVALRKAKLTFLHDHPEQASPFFWAPSVLYGSPASLPLHDPLLPVWMWWFVGGAALLLIAALLLWWVRSDRLSFSHLSLS